MGRRTSAQRRWRRPTLYRRGSPDTPSPRGCSWKPDLGLFLHAAQTMGVHPSRCIVVEDSVSGIHAAKAAGMRVLGFTGGDPGVEQELAAICEDLFHRMGDLPALLQDRIE
ncbi:HAD-IA family hydrolase [Bradyrhizobium betae]|uniref:HAD-IA family hydrolase n=1 Tax=Bradyrhizobium betae TaxID=244734 RepID=UPI0032E382F1